MVVIKSDSSVALAIGEHIINLRLPDSAHEISDWQRNSVVDLASAVAQAFDNPEDYPPLSSAIIEGDSVTLAIEPGLPQVQIVIQLVVEYLIKHGVPDSKITVLLAREHQSLATTLQQELLVEMGANIDVRFHHGDDPTTMGYLAAAENADAIYVDRSLLEADVVIPVTAARDPEAWAYTGLYGIVPWFTDSNTQNRWRNECANESVSDKAERLKSAREVAWLLGIQPVLAVVPGPQGQIDSVFFGAAEQVEVAIKNAVADRSINRPDEKVDLVVASIDGDQHQQTWENIARVISLSTEFVKPKGSIAIVSRLAHRPGPAFRWLKSLDEADKIESHLQKSSHPQSLSATAIFRARSNHSVYLMSELPSEIIEEIGLGVIDDSDALETLLSKNESSLVISGAQHRWIS